MRNKILITLGPSSLKEEIVSRCAGPDVYVFRINLSHTPLDKVEETIRLIRDWTDIPICLDSEGAQIRNETMRDSKAAFREGDMVKIHFESVLGDSENISFTPPGIARELKKGDLIRVDFDAVGMQVVERHDDHCLARVVEGGEVGSNKAADVDRDLRLTAITAKDEAAIAIGRDMGVKHFALSFANRRSDVERMRELCGPEARIISKIESRSGVANLIDILEATDEILIDRGDLSRQVPIERIPFMQRQIIAVAKTRSKPVFVATNLLESMIVSKGPTRAEVNDVASTLLMGADGLVLAAETAIGKYPAEAVEMIRCVIKQVDRWSDVNSLTEMLGA